MEREPKTESTEKYFETYEAQMKDLSLLVENADNLTASKLLDEITIREVRIVSFDSKNFYVLTQGEHRSTDQYKVQELPTNSKNGWRMYKINHSGWIGRKKEDYRGATAWLEHDSILGTAVGAELVDNPKIAEKEKKNKILKTILIPPHEPFERIQQGAFDYQTDMVFHESAHVEEMLIRDWPNKGKIDAFPSERQRGEFVETISASALPREIIDLLKENIDRATLGEMYAMLVDREAKRKYIPDRIGKKDMEMDAKLESLKVQEMKEWITGVMKSSHKKGYILARILEEKFPDYTERKMWLQKLMRE